MSQAVASERQRRYMPSVEGVRGYGFLAVFAAHYFPPDLFAHSSSVFGRLLFYVLLALGSVSAFAVPAFFVLSGYLIGGILYETRNREGYFKVFYSRRILRVFPVFYLTLLVIAIIDSIHGVRLDFHFWAHFLYIQNLLPGYASLTGAPSNQTIHFWSLAVEEQFYLLWPLVVWLFPERVKLLRITASLIAISCMLRLCTPLLHVSVEQTYLMTPTRVDAVLLGVLLALIRRDAIYCRIQPWAKYVALGGFSVSVLRALWCGDPWSSTYLGTAFLFPLVNATAVALVIAVMEEGSWLCRGCSKQWACWLGGLSYSLYVFHFTFHIWFFRTVVPALAEHMPRAIATLLSGAVALGLCLLLSVLSYRFIEGPALNIKKSLRYGADRRSLASGEAGATVVAHTGS